MYCHLLDFLFIETGRGLLRAYQTKECNIANLQRIRKMINLAWENAVNEKYASLPSMFWPLWTPFSPYVLLSVGVDSVHVCNIPAAAIVIKVPHLRENEEDRRTMCVRDQSFVSTPTILIHNVHQSPLISDTS